MNEYVTAVVSPRTADGTCSVPSAEGRSVMEEEDEEEREAREDGWREDEEGEERSMKRSKAVVWVR